MSAGSVNFDINIGKLQENIQGLQRLKNDLFSLDAAIKKNIDGWRERANVQKVVLTALRKEREENRKYIGSAQAISTALGNVNVALGAYGNSLLRAQASMTEQYKIGIKLKAQQEAEARRLKELAAFAKVTPQKLANAHAMNNLYDWQNQPKKSNFAEFAKREEAMRATNANIERMRQDNVAKLRRLGEVESQNAEKNAQKVAKVRRTIDLSEMKIRERNAAIRITAAQREAATKLKLAAKEQSDLAKRLAKQRAEESKAAAEREKLANRLAIAHIKAEERIALAAEKTRQAQTRAGQTAVNANARTANSMTRLNRAGHQQVDLWHKLYGSVKQLEGGYQTWWRRFGLIAVGFAVAYRAINAFENAVRSLGSTFTSGMRILSEYREGLAVISGMIATTYQSSGTFLDRFTAANNLMAESLKQAIRLAPKYRLSGEEITAGLRELAQFGVIPDAKKMEQTVTAFALIKEIAMTTGSSTKQIRQEIQALMQGQARVTDQFTRMIKITMPDLYDMLTDQSISTSDRWAMMTEALKDFSKAQEQAVKTIPAQMEIARMNLGILSMEAMDASGIFDKWVGALKKINDQLFDTKGNILPLGQKIKEIFADLWTSADYFFAALLNIGSVIKKLYTLSQELLGPHKELLVLGVKLLTVFTLLKTVFQMSATVVGFLMSVTGLKGLVKLLVTPMSVGGLIAAVKTFNTTLLALLAKLAIIPVAIVGAFAVSYAVGNELASLGRIIKLGFMEMFDQIADMTIASAVDLITALTMLPARIGFNFLDVLLNPKYYAQRVYDKVLLSEQLKANLLPDFSALWDSFRDGFEELAAKMKALASKEREANNQHYADIAKALQEKMAAAFDWTKGGLREKFTGAKQMFDDFVDTLRDKADEFAPGLIAEIEALIHNLLMVFGDGKVNLIKESEVALADLSALGQPQQQDLFEGYRTEMLDMTKQLAGDFNQVWNDVFDGNIRKTSELWESMLGAMLNSFRRAMANLVDIYFQEFLLRTIGKEATLLSIGKQFASALGMGIAGGMAGGTMADTYSLDGGRVGTEAVFDTWDYDSGIRRFAKGGLIPEHVIGYGLASGKAYEFGEAGPERVLSNADSFNAPQVSINIVNNSNASVQEEVNTRFDGAKMIIDVILDDYIRGGKTYKTLRG